MLLKKLVGRITPQEIATVERATKLRFADHSIFPDAAALLLYEQGVMSSDELTKMVQEVTGVDVETPVPQYLTAVIVDHFLGCDCVPIKYDNVAEKIYVGVLPHFSERPIKPYKNKEIVKVLVPMHWYVKYYTQIYTSPSFVLALPESQIFNFIVDEATSLGAADITIAMRANKAEVYYNVRKKRIQSRRTVSKDDVRKLAKYISSVAGSTIASNFRDPIYFSVNLNTHNRGRCVIAEMYHGLNISIRVLPNDLFEQTLSDLNLKEKTVKFIREVFLSEEKGLRLMVGPTFSGKNTTIAAALHELLSGATLKAVSVEQPVELLMDFIEQMSCDTEELYLASISSLLRQNPDVVYVTEITDYTAMPILTVSNTGKCVFSSIHANNLADVVSRLQDLTKLSSDRVVQSLHSMVYQELVRDESTDTIHPVTRCMYLSKELKRKLYGKSLGEVIRILEEEEDKW